MSSFCCKPLSGASALFAITLLLLSSNSAAQNSGKATLQYSSFVGGTSTFTYKVAIDSSNNIYAIGPVDFDLPTNLGAYQRYAKPSSLASHAIFIAKLNNVGTSAIFSTYFEGNGYDTPFGIAVDSARNIYIGLNTGSTNLPVVNGFQSSAKGHIYVAKFNPSGNTILYSSYYGGSNSDSAGELALDTEGRIYIGGGTNSTDLPITSNAFHQTANGSTTGFLARIDPKLIGAASLSYSTYLGVNLGVQAVAVDSAFNAYVTAQGFDDPSCVPQPGEGCFKRTPGAYDNMANSPNRGAFVAKFDATGSNLLWAAFLGATQAWQGPVDIKVDSMNQPVVVGFANLASLTSGGFPTTPGTFQPTPPGYYTGWVAKLSADGSQLLWGTYIGDGNEYPFGLAMNTNGEALVTGRTTGSHSNFPTTPDALYPSPPNAAEGSYVAKLNSSGAAEYASYVSNTFTWSTGVALNNKGDMFIGSWARPDLTTTNGAYSPGSGGGFVMRIGQNGPVTCVSSSSTADRSFVVCSPSVSGMTHEQVRFYARAKSNAGVQKISLFVDGILKSQVSGSLIDKTLSLFPGAHNISFVGADSGGSFGKSYVIYVNKNETPLSINCLSTASDGVKICSPANNATVYNAFEFSATANSSFGFIDSFVLYLDGKRYAFSGTPPLDFRLRVPPGTHRFTVNAWNNRGDVFTKTIYLSVRSFF